MKIKWGKLRGQYLEDVSVSVSHFPYCRRILGNAFGSPKKLENSSRALTPTSQTPDSSLLLHYRILFPMHSAHPQPTLSLNRHMKLSIVPASALLWVFRVFCWSFVVGAAGLLNEWTLSGLPATTVRRYCGLLKLSSVLGDSKYLKCLPTCESTPYLFAYQNLNIP